YFLPQRSDLCSYLPRTPRPRDRSCWPKSFGVQPRLSVRRKTQRRAMSVGYSSLTGFGYTMAASYSLRCFFVRGSFLWRIMNHSGLSSCAAGSPSWSASAVFCLLLSEETNVFHLLLMTRGARRRVSGYSCPKR